MGEGNGLITVAFISRAARRRDSSRSIRSCIDVLLLLPIQHFGSAVSLAPSTRNGRKVIGSKALGSPFRRVPIQSSRLSIFRLAALSQSLRGPLLVLNLASFKVPFFGTLRTFPSRFSVVQIGLFLFSHSQRPLKLGHFAFVPFCKFLEGTSSDRGGSLFNP